MTNKITYWVTHTPIRMGVFAYMRSPICDRFERVAWVRKRPVRLNARYR
jgi:hypothetical protein